jgi:hypothetical protein
VVERRVAVPEVAVFRGKRATAVARKEGRERTNVCSQAEKNFLLRLSERRPLTVRSGGGIQRK